jgi:NADH-quinone oxidoreductase subunit M
MQLLMLILMPLVSGLIILWFRKTIIVRFIGLVSALIVLLATIIIVWGPPAAEVSTGWIEILGIRFSLGLDGISKVMILLTNLVFPFIYLAGWNREQNHSSSMHALIFFTQAALIGVFTARNAFLFYIFWEMTLIPVYFILLLWGGNNRKIITLKFFIYIRNHFSVPADSRNPFDRVLCFLSAKPSCKNANLAFLGTIYRICN